MELLEGNSLASELRRKGALSIGRAARILIPVCDLLSKAHSAGIVHRDIKPDNIFLHRSEDGEVVKVVDFGIAKLMQASDSLDLKSLTATGGIIGTPDYIAPERFEDQPYDGRSDVYSLGVVLYETLSGRLPFQSFSGSLWELVRMRLTQEPRPLNEIDPNIPEEMQAIVMRALAKDPNRRPTAKELGEQFLTASGIESGIMISSGLKSMESVSSMLEENGKEPIFNEKPNRTGLTADGLQQIEKFLCSLLDVEYSTRQIEEKDEKDLLSVERWQRIENIFYSVVEMEPSRRAEFLDNACRDDPTLRRKIEALIEADQQAKL
jgi:serine/threonine protein kinase